MCLNRVLPDLPQTAPADEYNRALVGHVHPPDWSNPAPKGRYNIVVIGAGTAGLVTAAGAAGLGARVALVERALLGGDCLNVGCVPSKALLRCARAAAEVRRAGEFGVNVPSESTVDFPAVMDRMRRLRAEIAPHDSAARFRDMGVDVFIGEARFTARDTIEVAGQTLRFAKACIATGARPTAPPIEGLNEAGYLTNETVFSLTTLPRRLAIIGAGPIGCEMAQAFARFGSRVSLIEASDRIMGREDRDAAAFIEKVLKADGVDLLTSRHVTKVERDNSTKMLRFEDEGRNTPLSADEILIGVGRSPNVQDLALEKAGVEFDEKNGVRVDERLRTTNHNIYAAGDVCFPHKFTHMADAMARIVIRNALFMGRAKTGALTIPWCTYTDPEVAHVGLSEAEAREKSIRTQSISIALADNDRAIVEGDTTGFLKILLKRGSSRILGAILVAPHAGEMISELTLAIHQKIGLAKLAETIHPYPTMAEVFRKAGDEYNRTRLTPFVKKLFRAWLAWRR